MIKQGKYHAGPGAGAGQRALIISSTTSGQSRSKPEKDGIGLRYCCCFFQTLQTGDNTLSLRQITEYPASFHASTPPPSTFAFA